METTWRHLLGVISALVLRHSSRAKKKDILVGYRKILKGAVLQTTQGKLLRGKCKGYKCCLPGQIWNRKRFADVSWRVDQKYEVFKIAWRMVKTNEDIGDQSIQYDSAMTFSDNMKQLRKLIMRSFWTHI